MDKEILYFLALHDMAMGKHDLVVKQKDDDGVTHKIVFSRLKTNGIVVDIDKKRQNVDVYNFVDALFGSYDMMPTYLKIALRKAEYIQSAL